ncbi:MAG: VanZ family protein [Rhodospirillales bacterium]|nr:VanZ family protein [Acetobacter sp.]
MSKRLLTFVFGLLVAVAMAYTSTLSTQHKHALHTQGILHPWLHFFGFALLAFLLIRATRSQVLRIVLFAALLFFGWATEEHEGHRNGWPIEWKDVHTDEIGVALGFVLALIRPARQRTAAPELTTTN